ncbi:unnamed protein product [Lactuca saligna]|uniref:Uncharacterized protein n=1 Tax=Lactuca saligna TaxID=75948 RepID=A0AA35ZU88_LACSI|nr:unnamed protein product [Lactuca saligna]
MKAATTIFKDRRHHQKASIFVEDNRTLNFLVICKHSPSLDLDCHSCLQFSENDLECCCRFRTSPPPFIFSSCVVIICVRERDWRCIKTIDAHQSCSSMDEGSFQTSYSTSKFILFYYEQLVA